MTAQTLYKQRREACHPHKRLEHAPLHSYIQICILEYHWSPEEILLLLMLLDEQFLNLVLPVVEGGVGNPLALAVSQRRKTAGTLIFDDLEPFL